MFKHSLFSNGNNLSCQKEHEVFYFFTFLLFYSLIPSRVLRHGGKLANFRVRDGHKHHLSVYDTAANASRIGHCALIECGFCTVHIHARHRYRLGSLILSPSANVVITFVFEEEFNHAFLLNKLLLPTCPAGRHDGAPD